MPNHGTAADIAAIKNLTEAHLSAMARKDLAGLMELNTDDVVYLPPTSAPIVGKNAVKQMFETVFAQFSSIEQQAETSEIRVWGNIAIAWGAEAMKLMTPTGKVFTMRGYGMTVIERQPDGTWKFARGINNLAVIQEQ